jgi:hypothetical protein
VLNVRAEGHKRGWVERMANRFSKLLKEQAGASEACPFFDRDRVVREAGLTTGPYDPDAAPEDVPEDEGPVLKFDESAKKAEREEERRRIASMGRAKGVKTLVRQGSAAEDEVARRRQRELEEGQ